jgi:hypothetical protein
MAVITKTSIESAGATTVTETTLGASDTLVYSPARNPILILNNATAGALTPNIDGAGGTAVSVAGIGSVSVASGYTAPSIAAGAVVAIPLRSIAEYLRGTVTITGGTGIKASILEQ